MSLRPSPGRRQIGRDSVYLTDCPTLDILIIMVPRCTLLPLTLRALLMSLQLARIRLEEESLLLSTTSPATDLRDQ